MRFLRETERRFIRAIVEAYEMEPLPWTPADVSIGVEIGAELDPDVRVAWCAAYLRAVSRDELLRELAAN